MSTRQKYHHCNTIRNKMYYEFQVIPLGDARTNGSPRARTPAAVPAGAHNLNDPTQAHKQEPHLSTILLLHLTISNLESSVWAQAGRMYLEQTADQVPARCPSPQRSPIVHLQEPQPLRSQTPPRPEGWPGSRIGGQQVAGVGGDVG